MKKYFGITLVVMLLMVLCAIPSFAQGHEEPYYTHDLDLDAVIVLGAYYDGSYTRWDTIEGNAFSGASGITTVNLSSGNGNVLETNVEVSAYNEASMMELDGSLILAAGIYDFFSCGSNGYYTRWDSISDNAFMNATGITSVNMSSGNGNALQTNVGIEVCSPAIHNGPM